MDAYAPSCRDAEVVATYEASITHLPDPPDDAGASDVDGMNVSTPTRREGTEPVDDGPEESAERGVSGETLHLLKSYGSGNIDIDSNASEYRAPSDIKGEIMEFSASNHCGATEPDNDGTEEPVQAAETDEMPRAVRTYESVGAYIDGNASGYCASYLIEDENMDAGVSDRIGETEPDDCGSEDPVQAANTDEVLRVVRTYGTDGTYVGSDDSEYRASYVIEGENMDAGVSDRIEGTEPDEYYPEEPVETAETDEMLRAVRTYGPDETHTDSDASEYLASYLIEGENMDAGVSDRIGGTEPNDYGTEDPIETADKDEMLRAVRTHEPDGTYIDSNASEYRASYEGENMDADVSNHNPMSNHVVEGENMDAGVSDRIEKTEPDDYRSEEPVETADKDEMLRAVRTYETYGAYIDSNASEYRASHITDGENIDVGVSNRIGETEPDDYGPEEPIETAEKDEILRAVRLYGPDGTYVDSNASEYRTSYVIEGENMDACVSDRIGRTEQYDCIPEGPVKTAETDKMLRAVRTYEPDGTYVDSNAAKYRASYLIKGENMDAGMSKRIRGTGPDDHGTKKPVETGDTDGMLPAVRTYGNEGRHIRSNVSGYCASYGIKGENLAAGVSIRIGRIDPDNDGTKEPIETADQDKMPHAVRTYQCDRIYIDSNASEYRASHDVQDENMDAGASNLIGGNKPDDGGTEEPVEVADTDKMLRSMRSYGSGDLNVNFGASKYGDPSEIECEGGHPEEDEVDASFADELPTIFEIAGINSSTESLPGNMNRELLEGHAQMPLHKVSSSSGGGFLQSKRQARLQKASAKSEFEMRQLNHQLALTQQHTNEIIAMRREQAILEEKLREEKEEIAQRNMRLQHELQQLEVSAVQISCAEQEVAILAHECQAQLQILHQEKAHLRYNIMSMMEPSMTNASGHGMDTMQSHMIDHKENGEEEIGPHIAASNQVRYTVGSIQPPMTNHVENGKKEMGPNLVDYNQIEHMMGTVQPHMIYHVENGKEMMKHNLVTSSRSSDTLKTAPSSVYSHPEPKVPLVECKTNDSSMKKVPMYPKGTHIYYKNTVMNNEMPAIILDVYLDDMLEPYYLIRLEDGREKQTDNDHIRLLEIGMPTQSWEECERKVDP